MNQENKLRFIIYLIYILAENWKKTPVQVYQILDKTDVLDGYVLPCYDTLHTLGGRYLIEDISDFVKEKNIWHRI
ncbi:MAG: DUF3791 domain-containing protein [Eubacteriales bacterium]|nr:DUF3791 domain-containing protein [Eubacteriales bacterium]